MAVISVSPQAAWLRARWVVRRFLEDTLSLFPDDAELSHAIQQGLALDGLHLYLREPSLAKRLKDALIETIRQSAGPSPGPLKWSVGLSEEEREEYLQGLQELKAMLLSPA